MTGLFLTAWILFPLLVLLISAGLGLLVRRASGGALSGVLLLPVGFALAVSLCTLGTSITWLAPATGVVTLAIALAGLLLELRRCGLSRPRLSAGFTFPAVAALVGFGVIAAPVVLTGTPTWTGYARIVDTAFQMAFAQRLEEAGRSVPTGASSFIGTIQGLTGNGYPGGSQATLGALSAGVLRTNVAWCYQAYLACAAAAGALSLYALLRRVLASALLCCIGAAVAIQPNILYDYALVGGIKELTTAALILTIAAVLAEWVSSRPRSVRSALPLAAPLAAALASFSYGALPWVGLLLVGAFVVSLTRRGRMRTIATWAVAMAATGLLAIPTVIASIKLFGTAKEAVQGSVEVGLGNLAGPIPEISSVGVWIASDYRFPALAHATVSREFDYLVLILGTVGVLVALWRRAWMVAALGLAAPIAITYVVSHAGPWVELKGFTITAPIALAMAFVGAGALAGARTKRLRRAVRVAGWLGVAAVAGAVLYGNALTYHDMSLAPAARYRQLEQIGNRFAGVRERTFFPAFDEYSEMFLRKENGWDLVRPPGLEERPGAVHLAPGTFAFSLDLDQLELRFVESFTLLVLSRSPETSPPPANFQLVDTTPEFEVWKRVRPASEVYVHLPLNGGLKERGHGFCARLERDVRNAGPSATLAVAPAAVGSSMAPAQVTHPHYWPTLGGGGVRAIGEGTIEGSVTLPTTGVYEVWTPGSVGRPLTMYVDGKRAGALGYQERYPGQFLKFARVRLTAGTHRIRVTRPNGDLHPGSGDGPDGNSGLIGPFVFALQSKAPRIETVPGSKAQQICAAPVGYRWIEVLHTNTTA